MYAGRRCFEGGGREGGIVLNLVLKAALSVPGCLSELFAYYRLAEVAMVLHVYVVPPASLPSLLVHSLLCLSLTLTLSLVRYYNDLWELDVNETSWTPVGDPSAGPWPPCRSGCQMMLQGDTLYVYGGYVKVGRAVAMDPCMVQLLRQLAACGGYAEFREASGSPSRGPKAH